MFKLNFYDEKPYTLLPPKAFRLFKEKVSNNFGFSLEDADEFSYSYYTDDRKIFVKTENDYMEVINYLSKISKEKKILEIFIEINEQSKLFQECLKEDASNEELFNNEDMNKLKPENANEIKEEQKIAEVEIKYEAPPQKDQTSELVNINDEAELLREKAITESIRIDNDFISEIKPEVVINEPNKGFENQKSEVIIEAKPVEILNIDKNIINPNDQENKGKFPDVEANKVSGFIDNVFDSNVENISKNIEKSAFANSGEVKIEDVIAKILEEKLKGFKEEIMTTVEEKLVRRKEKCRRRQRSKELRDRQNIMDVQQDQNLSVKEVVDKKTEIISELESNKKLEDLLLNNNDGNNKQEESNEPEELHVWVTCDLCGMKPIKGIRYKCSVCPNFDLCENCEAASWKQHNHPFIKLRQSQFKMFGCRNACNKKNSSSCKNNTNNATTTSNNPFSKDNQEAQDPNMNCRGKEFREGKHKFKHPFGHFGSHFGKLWNKIMPNPAVFKAKEEKYKKIKNIQSLLGEETITEKEIKKALKLCNGDENKALMFLLENNQ